VNTGFAKRIGRLEEKMDIAEFERGSTKISWECLSWREQRLFERIQGLFREHGDGSGGIAKDILTENFETLTKGVDILVKRAFDLFLTAMSPFLGEDKMYEWTFLVRFHAFLVTTLNIIEMRQREDAFYQRVQEKYGDNWPEDLGEPDYAGIGERDFDKVLTSLIQSSFKEEQPKDGTG